MIEDRIKLTKSALNKFIVWSTSRYNNYLGLGTKKQNVDTVYNSLKNGFYTNDRGETDTEKTKFTIECAGSVGETYNGRSFRYWRTKGRKGDYSYEIDCIEKTVKGLQSKEVIAFLK